MKILVVGSGGREHALVWKIAQSPLVSVVYCTPGNVGIGQVAREVDISATDINALAEFALKTKIDLTVVGPELPLAMGIVDRFEAAHLPIFGPCQQAARIESSKGWAKNFMKKNNIPTANYQVYEEPAQAIAYLKTRQFPLVVKADGLAGGKGSIIVHDLETAQQVVQDLMVNQVLGSAGKKVVIEDVITGQEVSYMIFTDGHAIIPLIPCHDYKRVHEDDQGPNTGGMGAYAPIPWLIEAQQQIILKRIVEPTLEGLAREGIQYKGVLYFGLMINELGPYVLEFNARLGDPEAQVVLPLLQSDLIPILCNTISGQLEETPVDWSNQKSVCVVFASEGYPDAYRKGEVIHGLENILPAEVLVFHNGTAERNQTIISTGGRVLSLTALAPEFELARQRVYNAVQKVHFKGMHYRKDIAAQRSQSIY